MKLLNVALVAVAGLAVAPAANAQVNLHLINVQDLFSLSDGVAPDVGNVPAGVAMIKETKNVGGVDYVIDSLFIGGGNGSGVTTVNQIVKIEDLFNVSGGGRAFRTIPSSAVNMPNNRQFSGMDYVEGVGLVASWSLGGGGPTQVRVWDVNTQLNPILLASSPDGSSIAGFSGPGWDFGFNGEGFDYDGNGSKDGPVVSLGDHTINSAGPFGLNPTTLSVALGATLYEPGVNNGPTLNTADPFGAVISGTIWRDYDFHPQTGLIAARAANDLVIANRNANNSASIVRVVDGGNAPFVVGQGTAIMHGAVGGDLIAWVNRTNTTGPFPFQDVLRFVTDAGLPVTVNLLNPDGTPASYDYSGGAGTDIRPVGPIGTNGFFSVFWDRGLLVVVDGSSGPDGRKAYIFQQCLADVNHDGTVDLGDFFDFFSGFDVANVGVADITRDGTVDLADFFGFFSAFDAGC